MPLTYTFSRPVISGWNPTPTRMSGATRPRTVTGPAEGRGDAGEQPQQRGLAGAVAAEDAHGLARLDRRGRRRAAPTCSVRVGRENGSSERSSIACSCSCRSACRPRSARSAPRWSSPSHRRSTKSRSRRRWASRPTASSRTVIATAILTSRPGQRLAGAPMTWNSATIPVSGLRSTQPSRLPEQRPRVEDRRHVDPHERARPARGSARRGSTRAARDSTSDSADGEGRPAARTPGRGRAGRRPIGAPRNGSSAEEHDDRHHEADEVGRGTGRAGAARGGTTPCR